MSDGTTPTVWDEDHPEDQTSSSEPKAKIPPPPLPAFNPVVKEASNVPTGDLIQFESEEERAATVTEEGPQMETEAPLALERNPDMAMVLQQFLRMEASNAHADFSRMFYLQQIRVEQDKIRAEPEYKSFLGLCPQYYGKNRYRDILPYDSNRVEIQKDDDNPDGYMNASYIRLPGGKSHFIAAQAPLPSTLDGWWNMIDEQKVSLIVILCKLVEQNKIKCERYWPEKIGEPEMFGDYEITVEEEKTYDDDEYLLRILKMENLHTGETKKLHQLHYVEWPDHGCPSGHKQLLNMIDIMEQLHDEASPESPILVHCSAGVGRTGTIIAINYIREQIKAETLRNIDIFFLVVSLRKQRASMVQTQDQYHFVHKCVGTYCRRYLGLPEPKPEELPTQLPTGTTGTTGEQPVKLIAPPTPTTSTDQQPGGNIANYKPDRTQSIVEDDGEATTVPDFPGEPPAPMGPEDLGDSAAN